MASPAAPPAHASAYLTFSLVAVVIVLAIALPLFFWLQISWLWSYLLGINVATFALYGYDKGVAGSGRTRVPERVLHGAELLGGTPAAFIAQRLFHHKTAKGSYQVRFWIIVALQVVAVVALLWLRLA